MNVIEGLYWLRNDFRFDDNESLYKFCSENKNGIFILAETPTDRRAFSHRKKFLLESQLEFLSELHELKQKIFISNKTFPETLEDLLTKVKIQRIYFQKQSAFEEQTEEQFILNLATTHHIQLCPSDGTTLVHEQDLPFSVNTMPFIFTDFRKKVEAEWRIRPLVLDMMTEKNWPQPAVFETSLGLKSFTAEDFKEKIKQIENEITQPIKKVIIQNTPFNLIRGDLSEPAQAWIFDRQTKFKGGEKVALKHLQNYIWGSNSLESYKLTRNGLINWEDSSKISAWLNNGALSPRRVYFEVKKYEDEHMANDSTYWLIFELLWRDYFKFFSRRYKNKIFLTSGVQTPDLNIKKVKPSIIQYEFNRWINGATSDSFVNANMRELLLTGWMSNRGRQNVASYLIHALKIPWVMGAEYFESQLLDYDPDLNWGNWLYLSGFGSDPRSRKFNTQRQAEMYDENGEYQRIWN